MRLFIGFLYKHFLKKIFFLQDPETVHDHMTKVGIMLGNNRLTRTLTSAVFNYTNPALEQNILGIHFKNPIGLAAGFDKDAQLTKILPSVGFGFAEVGSITGQPCAGNPKPRLWRLPQSQSLMVYYGLKNQGSQTIAARLEQETFQFPIGTSIAKTNSPQTVERQNGIADYAKAFRAFTEIGDYYTINISCPNAYGGQPFTDAESFGELMATLDIIPTHKPVFIKLSPDTTTSEIDALLAAATNHRIHGFVIANLTKNRLNKKIKDSFVPDVGGMSGKVQEDLANHLISYVHTKTQGRYCIMGCGGVFTAADAYKKIKLGASLIQLITGMIYQGPQVIGQINQDLTALLAADGFKNISQAVGSSVR